MELTITSSTKVKLFKVSAEEDGESYYPFKLTVATEEAFPVEYVSVVLNRNEDTVALRYYPGKEEDVRSIVFIIQGPVKEKLKLVISSGHPRYEEFKQSLLEGIEDWREKSNESDFE